MLLETPSVSADLITFNPVKALKVIATTSAAERHWARAKDSTQLLEAVSAKLHAQAEYVVWRDSVVVPSRKTGAPGRGKRVPLRRSVLPDADPGHKMAYRWRKKLCRKTAHGTRIDGQKLEQEIKNTLARERPGSWPQMLRPPDEEGEPPRPAAHIRVRIQGPHRGRPDRPSQGASLRNQPR
jgi:hypothetical protein